MKRLINWLRDNWQVALFFLAIAAIVPICAFLQDGISETVTFVLAVIAALAQTILFVVLIVSGIKHSMKLKQEKYAEWVANSISNLRIIENRFRHKCKNIIDNSLSTGEWRQEITELEREYKYNLKEKLLERRPYTLYYVTSVPQYLAEAYQENISDIADTFRYLGDLLLEQKTRKEQ